MVLGLRDFTLSKEEFTEQYRQMMIESRYNYSRHWYSLLMRKEATLVEYSPGTFTYRALLAQWLQEWFPQYVRYMGER